jgi:hypothetical protein
MLLFHTVPSMLVHALCLRYLRNRLAADELRREVPLVGRLCLRLDTAGRERGYGAQTCLLMPLNRSVDPHVQLFSARVKTIDDRGLLVIGKEEVWRRKSCTVYPQALWAWIVDPHQLKPKRPDSIDAEEDALTMQEILRGK